MVKTFKEFSASLNEGFWDWLAGKSEPGQAKTQSTSSQVGVLETEVDQYYAALQDFITSGQSIPVQTYGKMKYSKLVEDIQIGLQFLGYPLAKHGVDGFFGPETANAIIKFNEDTLPKTMTIKND
jgi:peptidoglycan hydrolase-like protein with peptidoglycan-binding domain